MKAEPMNIRSLLSVLLPLLCFTTARTARAQEASTGSGRETYTDSVYLPAIHTVRLYNTSEEQSLPVLELGSDEQLVLSFDDLEGGFRDFYYTIEHCTAGWQPSAIPQIQYLKGFPGERIRDYQGSFNTYQAYTHYQLTLPDLSMQPLVSGNYVLKVYLDNDPRNLVLTRRFYVIQRKVSIDAEVTWSSRTSEREKRQKINLTVNHPHLQISNPFSDIQVHVSQNGRTDNAWKITRPVFVRASQLVYNGVDVADFYGGNEFRRFDLRSLRFRGEGVEQLVKDDLYIATLVRDEPRLSRAYSSLIDYNGKYYIRFQEGNAPDLEADYARVIFNFAAPPPPGGSYYVFGALTDWKLKEEFRMVYDPSGKVFQASPLLKQGVYDYMYVRADASGKIDALLTEGTHYETENDYYIFVYYRSPGARYDELIGFRRLNTLQTLR